MREEKDCENWKARRKELGRRIRVLVIIGWKELEESQDCDYPLPREKGGEVRRARAKGAGARAVGWRRQGWSRETRGAGARVVRPHWASRAPKAFVPRRQDRPGLVALPPSEALPGTAASASRPLGPASRRGAPGPDRSPWTNAGVSRPVPRAAFAPSAFGGGRLDAGR